MKTRKTTKTLRECGPPSRKIYKQCESSGEEQRELPVTAVGGRNLLPNDPEGTGETKS